MVRVDGFSCRGAGAESTVASVATVRAWKEDKVWATGLVEEDVEAAWDLEFPLRPSLCLM